MNRENLAYLAMCMSLIVGLLLWCSLTDFEASASHFEVINEAEETVTLRHVWETYSARLIPEKYAPTLATLNMMAQCLVTFVMLLIFHERQGGVVIG